MDAALHRFVRLLRLYGVRVSVAETIDALHAAAQPGVLTDREVLRSALAVTLVKDRRDLEAFNRVFDAFFGLRRVIEDDEVEHSHEHDDLSDEGDLTQFTLGEEPSDTPQQGHSHGKPVELHRFFKPEDLAQQYNLHQEANRLDMASLTDEIVLSADNRASQGEAARVQISASRLHNPGLPGELARRPGLTLDAELTVAEEMALLDWLADSLPDELPDDLSDGSRDAESLALLREALAPFLAALPQRLREHLERLMALEREVESREISVTTEHRVDEADRAHLEEGLRRLLRSLHGAPRPRRTVAARGVVDSARTMRTNMRYDGVPFRPVTVSKVEDRPRLLVLCDVSLSVRMTAKFTLHMVHSLASLATGVRTFAFCADLVEITDLFAEHRIEQALSLVVSGLPAGGLLDVDADSDYGRSFEQFVDQYGSAITRRSTVLVLGDGRCNGKDPRLDVFEDITRRARSTIWLTPEPRYSWHLGDCALPLYAEHCDRVQVVRSMRGLEQVSLTLAGADRIGVGSR